MQSCHACLSRGCWWFNRLILSQLFSELSSFDNATSHCLSHYLMSATSSSLSRHCFSCVPRQFRQFSCHCYVCLPSWIGRSLRGCVGNRHVTPSSALINALPWFFYSVSLGHHPSLLWYINGHLGVKPLLSFLLYSLVSLFHTSAFHSSRWGTVSFCSLWLYAYYFVPRLICALSRYTNISAFHSSCWDSSVLRLGF